MDQRAESGEQRAEVKNDRTLGTRQATAGTASGERDETGDSDEARTANGRRSQGIGKAGDGRRTEEVDRER
jgi:hypothetical protein